MTDPKNSGQPPRISIIIPIYNAGQYLNKRLESVTRQTLKDIEIILVLDCPTDGSDKIAEKYASFDNRIKLVYNEKNLHIGVSRNIGLAAASGEYIAFADHDDYCEFNMYEELYQIAIKNEADIVFSDMYLEKQNGQLVEKHYFSNNITQTRDLFITELLKGNGFYYSILNHIYRNKFLKDNGILFVDTRLATLEDRLFNLSAHQCAKTTIYSHNKYLYHVLYRQSTQHNYSFKSLNPMLKHLECMSAFFHTHPEYNTIYKSDYSKDAVKKLYYSFLPEIRYKSPFYALKTLSKIKQSPTIQETLKNLNKQQVSFSFPIKCFFLMVKFFFMPRHKNA